MNTVHLVANSNENFVFSRVVSDYAAFFNLDAGSFRAQMRRTVGDSVVPYTWSTAKGNISYSKIAAAGSVSIPTNPTAGSTLTIGTALIAVVASGPTGNQIAVAGSVATFLTALLAFLNASSDAQIAKCSYALAGTTLLVTYKTPGIAGNTFGLVTTISGASTSGQGLSPPANTLSGGAVVVEMTAPLSDIEQFSDAYVYDFRFEGNDGLTFVVLFGGSLTFNQGVTT